MIDKQREDFNRLLNELVYEANSVDILSESNYLSEVRRELTALAESLPSIPNASDLSDDELCELAMDVLRERRKRGL